MKVVNFTLLVLPFLIIGFGIGELVFNGGKFTTVCSYSAVIFVFMRIVITGCRNKWYSQEEYEELENKIKELKSHQ